MTTSVSSFPVVSKKGSSRSIKREGKIPGEKKTRGDHPLFASLLLSRLCLYIKASITNHHK